MKKLFIIFALTFFLVGCEKNNEQPQKINRCEGVPQTVISNIESGLKINGCGSLRNAKAVKSNDFSSVYFVSANLKGDGLEDNDNIATFAVNNLDGSGLIFSVNYVAKEFSDWSFGPDTSANISMSDDGAYESANCVKN